MRKKLLLCLLPIVAALLCATQAWASTPVRLTFPQSNNVTFADDDGEYTITTTGGDPYLYTAALVNDLPEGATTLSFEYQSTAALDASSKLQLFFGYPPSEARSISYGNLAASSEWKEYTVDISTPANDWGFGKAGDQMRFDFGTKSGVTIKIRRLCIRKADEAWDNPEPKEAIQPVLPKYTISGKFELDHWSCGLLFGKQTDGTFYMWQFSANGGSLFNPHMNVKGSWSPLGQKDISSLIKLEEGKEYTFRIEITGDSLASTYINDILIDKDREGHFPISALGIRTSDAEAAYFDDIKVYTADKTYLNYTFDSADDAYSPGTVKVGGSSASSRFFMGNTAGEAIVWLPLGTTLLPRNYTNILFIGNSFTLHGVAAYWWQARGMASSVKGLDYATIVTNALKPKISTISGAAGVVEAMWNSSYTYEQWYPITADYDLVVVQLCENIQDVATVRPILDGLYAYLKQKCPNATFLHLASWTTPEKLSMIQSITTKYNVPLLNCHDETYTGQIVIGDYVTGTSLTDLHAIDNPAVALHPSDVGMELIANRVLTALGKPEVNHMHNIAIQPIDGCTLTTPYGKWVEGGIVNVRMTYTGTKQVLKVVDAQGNQVETTVNGNRTLFVMPSSDVTISDANATGIETIGADKAAADARVFTITGQLVGNSLQGLAPGIYIQGGKKVIVK